MKIADILFNDELDTFYLRFYRVGGIVKEYSDNERRNPISPRHALLFVMISKGYFFTHQTKRRIVNMAVCVTSVVEHSLE